MASSVLYGRGRGTQGQASSLVHKASTAAVTVAVFAWRADEARVRAELRQGQAEELLCFVVVDLRDKLDPMAESLGLAQLFFVSGRCDRNCGS